MAWWKARVASGAGRRSRMRTVPAPVSQSSSRDTPGGNSEMTVVGTGKYTYRLTENWATLPPGETFGNVSAVATDSQDRVYVFQRKDPPVLIFDRDGAYLRCWGIGALPIR